MEEAQSEHRRLGNKLRNWGRWGADDERGTINFITPEKVIEAGRLVRVLPQFRRQIITNPVAHRFMDRLHGIKILQFRFPALPKGADHFLQHFGEFFVKRRIFLHMFADRLHHCPGRNGPPELMPGGPDVRCYSFMRI